jgi:hypothetical protein
MTGCGRLAHNQVTGSIHNSLQAAQFGPALEIVAQLLFMLGGTGNFAQGLEMLPDSLRLKLGDVDHNVSFDMTC